MKITDVRVKHVESDSRLRGVATITFDDSFVVHDIQYLKAKQLFVAMPSKKLPAAVLEILHINSWGYAEDD